MIGEQGLTLTCQNRCGDSLGYHQGQLTRFRIIEQWILYLSNLISPFPYCK